MKKSILVFFSIFFISLTLLNAQTDPEDDFYNVNKIQEIRIDFPTRNWQYVLDSLRTNGDGLFLANVAINGKNYKDAGVRYRGTQSFKTGRKRNPLHIKLNYISKTQNHQGYKTIKLSSALRDPSMVREVLSYEIAGTYMPAPKANYTQIFVNNEFYGLFINIEAVSDEFLEENFGTSGGSFFKASPNAAKNSSRCSSEGIVALEYADNTNCYLQNFELESAEGWDDLIELTKVLKEKPEEIESILNVDRTLWMLAFNNVVANLNSYSGQQSQNFYLFRDTLTQQFTPIIWDLNLSFGSFKNTGVGSDLSLKELQTMSPLLHENNQNKPLIYKLLSNPRYKKIYLSHLRQIVKDYFISGQYEMRAKELQQMIRVPLGNSPNWNYTVNDFNKSLLSTIGKRSRIPGLVELMQKRGKYLYAHPELSVLAPKVLEVKVKKREKLSQEKVENFAITAKVERFPKQVMLYYRYAPNQNFSMVNMEQSKSVNSGVDTDEFYTYTLNPTKGQEEVEYYIIVENPKAINFSPPHYMRERHRASLSDLNQ